MTDNPHCKVCDGTGWFQYPHPDGEGGMTMAVRECPECVEQDLCAACGEGLMDWGALRICVRCGFTFDEAAAPDMSNWGAL